MIRSAVTVLMVLLFTSCGLSTSSSMIGDLVADQGDVETCGPIWVDSIDPVNLVWVLSYGPPRDFEVSFVGSTVEWLEVEYETSVSMTIDTYVMRGVGIDAVEDLFSRTFLGGVVDYAQIAPLLEDYGTPLPASYVSEPGEGVILLGIARSATPVAGTQVSYQAIRVEFRIDGVPGAVTPREWVARAEAVATARQDPSYLEYCE